MVEQRSWGGIFTSEVSDLAEGVKQEAYANCKHYGEASLYVRKLKQFSYGEANDRTAFASMKLAEAVCDLATSMIHEDERNLPIKHEEE